jgi:hypothetical protein
MTARVQQIPLGNVPAVAFLQGHPPNRAVRDSAPREPLNLPQRTRTGPLVSGREQRCRPDPVIASKQDSLP